MSFKDTRIKTRFIIIFAVFSISFGSIFARLVSAQPLIIAMYRMVFSVLLLLPYVLLVKKQELRLIKGRGIFFVIASGVFLGLHFATWISSLMYTSIASSTVLVCIHPVFIVFFSFVILKKKVSKVVIIIILLITAGVFLISMGDLSGGSDILLGDVLAIVGSICMAGYLVTGTYFKKHYKEVSNITYIFAVYLIASVVLFLISLINSENFLPKDSSDWVLFIAMALVCTVVGHGLLNWSLKEGDMLFVSAAVLAEPVFASIWATFLFAEVPTITQVFGGIIIIFGLNLYFKISIKQVL